MIQRGNRPVIVANAMHVVHVLIMHMCFSCTVGFYFITVYFILPSHGVTVSEKYLILMDHDPVV